MTDLITRPQSPECPMTLDELKALAPGADVAHANGCKCPRMDNAYGRGFMGGAKDKDGKTVFVITESCPLHGNHSPTP